MCVEHGADGRMAQSDRRTVMGRASNTHAGHIEHPYRSA